MRHRTLVSGLTAVLVLAAVSGRAAQKPQPAVLDDGRLQKSWFGGDFEFRETDDIDPAVGLTDVAGVGEDAGRLAPGHARDEQSAAAAEDAVRAAMRTGDGPAEPPPLTERLT